MARQVVPIALATTVHRTAHNVSTVPLIEPRDPHARYLASIGGHLTVIEYT